MAPGSLPAPYGLWVRDATGERHSRRVIPATTPGRDAPSRSVYERARIRDLRIVYPGGRTIGFPRGPLSAPACRCLRAEPTPGKAQEAPVRPSRGDRRCDARGRVRPPARFDPHQRPRLVHRRPQDHRIRPRLSNALPRPPPTPPPPPPVHPTRRPPPPPGPRLHLRRRPAPPAVARRALRTPKSPAPGPRPPPRQHSTRRSPRSRPSAANSRKRPSPSRSNRPSRAFRSKPRARPSTRSTTSAASWLPPGAPRPTPSPRRSPGPRTRT